MENRSLVTIAEHSKEKILYLLEMAREFEKKPNRSLLAGRIVATLFFEPSTRTRLSFETAANRLGAKVIGFTDPKVTSSSKGETLKDTIMMVSNYADIIVMRHYLEGAARYASEVTKVPIVNAGDGANQHPSQTMLDLYSIYKTQGTLENLNIYMVGDLKYGRTVHSLLMAMRHFNPTFHFIAPDELKMPEEYKIYCKEHNIKYVEHTDFNENVIADADILYMTRVQRERFTDLMEYERVKDVYILNNKMLDKTRPNLRELQVAALENGTVIDHIPSDKLFTVVSLLNLKDMDSNITIGYNLESKKLGKKGIIKIADKFFTDEEINRISVVASNIKLNVIRNYAVVEKKEAIMPDELKGIVKCNNPKCITNNEPMQTWFHVTDKEKGLLKCHYCEKEQQKDNIKLI